MRCRWLGADGKPSVPAAAKRFGDGVEADEVLIEGGTFLQVLNGKGNVVDDGLLCVHGNGYCEKKRRRNADFMPALWPKCKLLGGLFSA